MKIIFLIARIVLGLYYLFNASNHFFQLKMMAGYTASKGVPLPEVFVIVTGILLLIGGVTILSGYRPTIGIVALVVFFLPVTLIMHNFWAVDDQMMKMMEMVQFLKNTALFASAVMFLAIPQPWPLSLKRK